MHNNGGRLAYLYIVGFQRFLELPLRHEVLELPDGPDGSLVLVCEDEWEGALLLVLGEPPGERLRVLPTAGRRELLQTGVAVLHPDLVPEVVQDRGPKGLPGPPDGQPVDKRRVVLKRRRRFRRDHVDAPGGEAVVKSV